MTGRKAGKEDRSGRTGEGDAVPGYTYTYVHIHEKWMGQGWDRVCSELLAYIPPSTT